MWYSYRFTKVAVDSQVKALDGKVYDILYIGTGELPRDYCQRRTQNATVYLINVIV